VWLPLAGIIDSEFRAAAPTVVLTQSLCDVCAPSTSAVTAACARQRESNPLPSPEEARVVNLEPHSLEDVAQTFVAVSNAVLDTPAPGQELAAQFRGELAEVARICTSTSRRRPKCVMLEWTEPLFDGGHWIPEMMALAGATYTLRTVGEKSQQIDPATLAALDPDTIVVACCGFDLARNLADAAKLWQRPWWVALRAVREGRVFAADGNRFFARPGPSLVGGTAILARCTHAGDPQVVAALAASGLLPAEHVAWAQIAAPDQARLAASGSCKPEPPPACSGLLVAPPEVTAVGLAQAACEGEGRHGVGDRGHPRSPAWGEPSSRDVRL
jgi:iron complex transport system substrate-binding protein